MFKSPNITILIVFQATEVQHRNIYPTILPIVHIYESNLFGINLNQQNRENNITFIIMICAMDLRKVVKTPGSWLYKVNI